MRAGKVSDSFRISFKKLGHDLCYFYRPYRDKKQSARWVLDANREISRCHCFPIAPSGSSSGSASAADAGVAPSPPG